MPTKKKTKGRPRTVLTDKERGEVETLASVLTQEQIADYFGIGRSTLQKMLAEDEDLSGLYQKGRARAIAGVAKNLLAETRAGICPTCKRGANLGAQIFYLKTQAKWTERVEVAEVDPEGRPRLPLDIVPALAAITGLRAEDFDLSKLRSEPSSNGKEGKGR